MEADWRSDLETWLAPFVAGLRNKTRGRMCPAYIAGLIGPGDRKSVQPMAARNGEVSYDRLHHFIGSGIWDEVPLEMALLAEADRQVGGEDAWLIIDDTALPKKGRHSVGVAPQYASALGKNANCQTLVSLTLASREVPVMVGSRLFLPESWTSDVSRLERAGVPEDLRSYMTKPEIALAEIDKVRAAGVRFGCVLADAGYGLSDPFRQGLSERGLAWAVGIPFKQKVYPADVTMIFPVAGRGRPRKNAIPDIISVSAQAMLETVPWRKVSWRRGTKGQLAARFAAVRVRVADGSPQRIHDMGAHPGRAHQPVANPVRPRDLQHLAMERSELAPQRCPRCQHGADHCFQHHMSGGQFLDARFEPASADLADLQPVAAQYAADTELDVEQLALQQLAANEQCAGVLGAHRLDVDRPIPSHPQQLRDPARVLPIGLHRHRRQRRLHMARLQQHDIEAGGDKASIQPLR